MIYLSVCSGIEAATVAWHPLGWKAAWYSEIEPFPSAVLKHHYPETPNLGDMTKFKEWPDAAIDLLVGGTPCQSFSVAGLRKGLADPRGNLMLTYLAIAQRYRPQWLVWENVPGVLSSNKGRDFGTFLGGLAELGYGFAYRVLDAQYFGVPQRRRRVFVVGYLGDWRPAAAVLFERHSLQGNPPPGRKAREAVAGTIDASLGRSRGAGQSVAALTATGVGTCGADDNQGQVGHLIADPHVDICPALKARDYKGPSSDGDGDGAILIPMTAHTLKGEGFDASPRDDTDLTLIPILEVGKGSSSRGAGPNGCGIGKAGDPMYTLQAGAQHAVAFSCKDHGADAGDISPTLRSMNFDKSHANAGGQIAVAFQEAQTGCREYENAGCLRANGPGHDPVGTRIRHGTAVRRLTPRECSRLQGFPDDYLEIEYANATEAHTTQILHELWKATYQIEREGWRPGIIASLLTQEILLSGVYVGWFSWEVARRCAETRGSISGETDWMEGFLRALREAEEYRYSPYQRRSFGQFSIELEKPLSELPLERTQAAKSLLNCQLWEEAQRAWPLRYALTTRKKKEKMNPDGPRYKALGNSMATPVMRWLGERIQQVNKLMEINK